MTNEEYKRWLIEAIIEIQTKKQFSKYELEKKSIEKLEKIYDNVE